MKKLFYLCLACGLPVVAAAQTMTVTNASGKYNAKITGLKCEGTRCSGAAKVQLLEKERNRSVQLLESDDLPVALESSYEKGAKQVHLAEGEFPLVFDDFDFDGEEDVAIRNGSRGNNGSASYDVYLYNPSRKSFSLDKQLTRLASDNDGMFETDRRRKQLIVFRKEGCCRRVTLTYGVAPGKGPARVEELTEEVSAGGDMVTVTTAQLVNGKMKRSVKQYKTSEYYKDGAPER